MEQIKSSFTIDIKNSPQYNWVKSITFSYQNGSITPEKRCEEYNVLLTLSLIEMMINKNDNYNSLPNILGVEYLYKIILSYCNYYFMSKNQTIHQEQYQQLKILIDPLVKEYITYLNKLIEKKDSDPEIPPYSLFNSVRVFSIPDFENREEKIIKEICEKLLNVEVIEKLEPGMIVCGYSLIECVSKKDGSEVWKAGKNGRLNALKIQNTGFEDKFIKKNKHEKIIEEIKSTDAEYVNYTSLLPSFIYKLSYFAIDYFRPLNMKVKIMTWCDGPINKLHIDNKGEAIKNIILMLQTLHREKLCLSNLKPEHILYDEKDKKYVFISYSYIIPHLGTLIYNLNNYSSLFLLSGNLKVTYYDDLESLFYIYDELISGKKKYENIQLEASYKFDLSIFNITTKDIIQYIRQLKESDQYLTTEITPDEFKNYIDVYYSYIYKSFEYLLSQKTELSITDTDLSDIDKARLKRITSYLVNDPIYIQYIKNNPAFVNELAIKILNFMITGCEYDIESQQLINNFLLSK